MWSYYGLGDIEMKVFVCVWSTIVFLSKTSHDQDQRHNKRQRNMLAERVDLDVVLTILTSLLPFLMLWVMLYFRQGTLILGQPIMVISDQAAAQRKRQHTLYQPSSAWLHSSPSFLILYLVSLLNVISKRWGLIITWKRMYPTHAIRNILKHSHTVIYEQDNIDGNKGKLWLSEVIQIISENIHMNIYLFFGPLETSGYIMNCTVTDKSLVFFFTMWKSEIHPYLIPQVCWIWSQSRQGWNCTEWLGFTSVVRGAVPWHNLFLECSTKSSEWTSEVLNSIAATLSVTCRRSHERHRTGKRKWNLSLNVWSEVDADTRS